VNTKFFAASAAVIGLLTVGGKTQSQILINFDTTATGETLTAPTLFSAANPLRDEYASLGVRFQGSNANSLNGGAILRSTQALSGTNVLAFNSNARMLNNGLASAPENLIFDTSITSFSIWAAGPNVDTVFFARAFDANNFEILEGEATSQGGAFTQLTVSGTGIRRIELTAEFLATPRQPFLMFDNLSFAPVPAPSSALVAVMGAGMAGIALRRKRQR
jgi:hypothetical protein